MARFGRKPPVPAGTTGDDRWVVGRLAGPDGPAIVMADSTLARADHPGADIHVTVNVTIFGGGMPDDRQAARLNAEEDDLATRFAEIGAFAGRTTRPGVRTMHFVASDVESVKRVIDAWAAGLPELPEGSRKLRVGFQMDRGWIFLRRDLGLG